MPPRRKFLFKNCVVGNNKFFPVLVLVPNGASFNILVKYSLEISKIKLLGKSKIMHNVCYTDNVKYSQAHGNSEPHV